MAALALLIAGTSASYAVPVCNSGPPAPDVTTLGTCTFGGLTFSNWSVTNTLGGPISVGFSSGSDVNGNWVNVQFGVSGGSAGGNFGPPNDNILKYRVTANTGSLTGIDILLGRSTSGWVTISEGAFNNDVKVGDCAVSNAANVLACEDFFPGVSYLDIEKDIGIGRVADIGSLSDFKNSHHWVPEPGSLALLGLGLLGLGSATRRRKA